MDITQSRLLSYMELPAMAEALSRCKVISAGGEKYPPILYERLRAIAPNTVLINSYGPTETTIACNCTALTGSRITIGPPLWNVVERIVDMDGHDLPPGVVGELWIGGQGVGRGYFGNPELTARHFVEHNGTRYYRSGDLGKWTTAGQVVILGRNDGQIKLRGLRIELGEIENVLAAVPGIRACAVVVRSIAGREHLCAYYTASRSWEPDALRTLLSASLARYMVPTAYLHMDKLPETPSGKTDLKSLPEPLLAARREYIAPRTDTERIFCDIFAKVLGLDTISADDDFFDLGGTSLLVTRVVILALEHGLELTFGDIFSGRTPEGLAAQKSDADHVAQAEQQEHEYEYSAINSILAENTLDAFGAGSCRELGNVALTGATGFLGIHILREYLRSETGLIQCLVRGGIIPAQERLQGLLAYYFEDRFEDAFANRIRVVEGDVTDVAVLARLGERPVDTLINCAANVKHFAAGSEIEEINVGGVRHCLDFCHEQGCRFIQISTTSVAGMSVENEPPEDTVLTEQMLYFGQNLDNKYIHSKFLAERLTLDAVARRGVDAKIMRVGNLMARQDDGEFQINFNTNSFVGTLRAYYRIGKIPFEALGESAEFTPVDSTARAILHLSRTPAQCRVFHPTNNHNIFIGDVIWALKQHGISITPCEMDEFEKAYSQALHNPNLARELAPLIAYSNMAGNRRASSLESTNTYTTQMLYRLGFTWPVPGQGYLGRFMGALSGLGFFD
ncbi:MAG: AMP-binding protein [Desulfovibrionales bacterium]|nr:AMP-binding protein [Desulfovibrionales bacterium]